MMEKTEKLMQQRRDAQKRYYEKNKNKCVEYGKKYYANIKQSDNNNNIAIKYMQNYINNEPENVTTTPIKIEFREVIAILKGEKSF